MGLNISVARVTLAAIGTAAGAVAVQAGPVSKFADRAPVEVLSSARSLEDVERCLMDMDGQPMPQVTRQPDRPDEAQLFWNVQAATVARIDLKRDGGGTRITSWMKARQVAACAASDELPR